MKKSFQLIFVAGLLQAISISCAAISTPAPPTSTPVPPTSTLVPTPTATPIIYNAVVSVVDENGNLVSDAKIIQNEMVELTDNQGVWQGSSLSPDLSLNIWAQGYLLQEHSLTMQTDSNEAPIKLSPDPLGLKTSDLEKEGYELVFVEDFQDNISDCLIEGNGNVVIDDTNSENYLLLADLRNLDDGFTCSFGPTNLEDAILEVDFRYVDIRFDDFEDGEYYNWQGYFMGFRDDFSVSGYPLQVPWGPTLQITDRSEEEWKFPVQIKQGIQESRWYTLYTKYEGQKVEVRIDGLLKFNFLNPPTMISTEPAIIGAFNQSHIQFDNIKMWVPQNQQ